jgi:hypothetical protein
MRIRTIAGRLTATALAASLTAVATTASAGSAAAALPGVGTGSMSTSVLDAALGELLGVTLLQDVGSSTTDPKVGPAGASSVFTSLKLSSTVPALNKTLGEQRVAAPGGPGESSSALLDLNSLGLGAVVSGTIEPILLKALHQPSSATASSARITDLGLLGGLANLGVVSATDRTGSGTAGAEAARDMSLDALGVLALGPLLRGLGLDLLTLPLSVISGLVTSLGIPLNLAGASSLSALVQSITGSIATLSSTSSPTVIQPVITVLDGLGLPAVLQPVVDTLVPTALNALQATLTSLIESVLDLLENATLLKLNALDISTVARATDSVSTSTATATGTLGGLQIGGLTLPGIDLAAVTGTINGLLAQVQAALSSVLGPLGIGDLLSLRLFDRQTGVTESDGVVKAVSSITGAVLKVTPPTDLLGTVTRLTDQSGGLGGLLGASNRLAAARSSTSDRAFTAATSSSPALTAAASPLEGLLGVTSILSKGLELRLGTVQSQSLHGVPTGIVPLVDPPTTPVSITPGITPNGKLPRTGGDQSILALTALGLGAVALGARRLVRRGAR